MHNKPLLSPPSRERERGLREAAGYACASAGWRVRLVRGGRAAGRSSPRIGPVRTHAKSKRKASCRRRRESPGPFSGPLSLAPPATPFLRVPLAAQSRPHIIRLLSPRCPSSPCPALPRPDPPAAAAAASSPSTTAAALLAALGRAEEHSVRVAARVVGSALPMPISLDRPNLSRARAPASSSEAISPLRVPGRLACPHRGWPLRNPTHARDSLPVG